MKISVAMCTYNGVRYLQDQLDSINAQQRLPDEVVICDDTSQDETRQIIEAFAQAAQFPVRLYYNENNLGYTKNFEQAIRYCSGDIIALCDQDDVWHPQKLQTIEAALAASDVGLIFSDADIIDSDSQPLDYRLWQCADFSQQRWDLFKEGRAVEALLTQNVVTGATMAFRACFRDLVLPIPGGKPIIHDWWIALMIGAVSKILPLDKPLIAYRRHESQHMGFRTDRDRVFPPEHYETFAQQLEIMAARLRSTPVTTNPHFARGLTQIEDKARHLRVRLALPGPKWRRLLGITTELVSRRYHLYSNGWRSAARDLLF